MEPPCVTSEPIRTFCPGHTPATVKLVEGEAATRRTHANGHGSLREGSITLSLSLSHDPPRDGVVVRHLRIDLHLLHQGKRCDWGGGGCGWSKSLATLAPRQVGILAIVCRQHPSSVPDCLSHQSPPNRSTPSARPTPTPRQRPAGLHQSGTYKAVKARPATAPGGRCGSEPTIPLSLTVSLSRALALPFSLSLSLAGSFSRSL